MHPGVVKTNLVKHYRDSNNKGGTFDTIFDKILNFQFRLAIGVKDVAQGAATSGISFSFILFHLHLTFFSPLVYVATAPHLERVGGNYFEDSKQSRAGRHATNLEVSQPRGVDEKRSD